MEILDRTIRVRLRGTEYDEAEARVRECSVTEALASYKSDKALVDAFAANVESWNLRRQGEPIPCTEDNARALPPHLLLSLATQYIRDLTTPVRDRPTRPLEPSTNGAVQGTEITAL